MINLPHQDRHTFEPSTYIDVNLEDLRDILRRTLGNIKGLDLREDKLSVRCLIIPMGSS